MVASIQLALWLILFSLQNLGFWEILQEKTDVKNEYIPGLTIALQITALFFGGLFNLLPEVTALLWILGIGLFFYQVYRRRSFTFLRKYVTAMYIYMAVWLALLLVFVYGKKLTHYDDFSHWWRVAKSILTTDRFPTFKEHYIYFQQYPLGSAAYIYYCVRFFGSEAQWQSVFCQMYMELAFLLPILGKLKKNRILGTLFAFLYTNFFLLYGENVVSLLVDTLVALAGMSMLLYTAEYCRAGAEKGPAFWLTGAYILAVSQIKNSEIFFVCIALCYIFWHGISDHQWKHRLFLIGCALLGYVLWSQHCKYVFVDASHSIHAMSMANYKDNILGVSSGQLVTLCKIFVLTGLSFRDNWLCLAGIVMIGALVYWVKPGHFSSYRKSAALACLLYGLYEFGTLLMYVFSMGTDQSMTMPSYYRYAKTGLSAVVYWLCLEGVGLLNSLSFKKYGQSIAAFLILAFLPGYRIASGISPLLFCSEKAVSRTREQIENAVSNADIPEKATCTILLSDSDADYCVHVATCYQTNWSVHSTVVQSMQDLDHISSDYVLVLDWNNSYILQWAENTCPDQVPNTLLKLS